MTFLNAALLAGAVTAAIPLVIHLLNRTRVETVDWGASHLLDAAIRANSRRPRLQNLLLLLIRCLIPAAVAICLARPVLTSATSGGGPLSIVFVLDDSRSMAAGRGSVWDDARAAVAAVVNASADGSDFALVLAGGPPQSVTSDPIREGDRVAEMVAAAAADTGAVRSGDALTLARAQAETMASPNRRIVVLSDFQQGDWADVEANPREADPREAAARDTAADTSALPAELLLWPIRGRRDRNVAVGPVTPLLATAAVGQPSTVTVELASSEDAADVTVSMTIDAADAGRQSVELKGGRPVSLRFEVPPLEAGLHRIEVHVAEDDDNPADDRSTALVRVGEKTEVLILDDRAAFGAADYVGLALTAGSSGFAATQMPTGDLSPDVIETAEVLVLAETDTLSDETIARLAEFVDAGGGMLILPPTTAADARVPSGSGLLAARWVQPRTREDRPAGGRLEHPALAPLTAAGVRLSDLTVRRVWRVAPRADSVVAARLAGGDVWVVARDAGAGRVLQMTVPLDEQSGDLPLRPAFIPLMRTLATYLVGGRPDRANWMVGTVATVRLPEGAGERAIVTTPGGATIDRPVGSGRRVSFDATRRAGVYQVDSGGATSQFNVQVPLDESTSVPMTDGDLAAVAQRLGGTVVASAGDVLRSGSGGRAVWTWVVFALVAFLVAEVALLRRSSGGRR